MKNVITLIAMALIAIFPARAKDIGTYIQQRGNGDALVFFLSDAPSSIRQCYYGYRANIVLYDAISRSGLPFASGCWGVSKQGSLISVHLFKKSDNEQHETSFSVTDVKTERGFSGWSSYTH